MSWMYATTTPSLPPYQSSDLPLYQVQSNRSIHSGACDVPCLGQQGNGNKAMSPLV